MDELRDNLMEQLRTRPGASKEAISALIASLGTSLPEDYLDFLRLSNGATGIGPNLFVILDRAEDVPGTTRGYRRPGSAPGLVILGSDGCGNLIGIDTRSGDPALMEYLWGDAVTLDCNHVSYRANSILDLLAYLDSYYSSMDEPAG